MTEHKNTLCRENDAESGSTRTVAVIGPRVKSPESDQLKDTPSKIVAVIGPTVKSREFASGVQREEIQRESSDALDNQCLNANVSSHLDSIGTSLGLGWPDYVI